MKEYCLENIIIKKNIDYIYNIYLENNETLLNTLFNIKTYQSGQWTINNKEKSRIDTMEIEIQDLPDIISSSFLKNTKILCLKIKIIILEDTPDVKYVKSKISFSNIDYNNVIIKNIINYTSNKLIKLKNKTKIIKLDDNSTIYSTRYRSTTYLPSPYKDIIENFSFVFCKKIIDSSIEFLNNN